MPKSMIMYTDPAPSALPDPMLQPAFYQGVLPKRALAWGVDVLILGLLAALTATITLIGWFFFPFIYLVISFFYRTVLLQGGGTFGMRLMGVEIRGRSGHRLTGAEAAVHTLVYMTSMAFVVPMLISWGLMVSTVRGQGLADLALGSAAINRPDFS